MSIYLKYRKNRESQKELKRVELLLRSSRPNEYFLELLDKIFRELPKGPMAGAQYRELNAKTQRNEGVRCTWFVIGEQTELLGIWTISESEVSELLAYAADEQDLRQHLKSYVLGPWDQGGLPSLAAKITSYVQAWLLTRHGDFAPNWQINWVFEDPPKGVFSVALRERGAFTAEFTLTSDDVDRLRSLPAHELGVIVALNVDTWVGKCIEQDFPLKRGRPDMSSFLNSLQ